MKNRNKITRHYVYPILLIILLHLTGCQSKNEINEVRTFEKFQNERRVSFINLFEFKSGVPCKIHSIDSTLIICDAFGGKNGSFFYNYSLNNKTLSKGYFKGGRGPSEALVSFTSGIIGKLIWSYDIILKRVTIIDKDKALKQKENIEIKQYPINQISYQIDFKDTNTILSVGNPKSKYKIQEIDLKSGKTIVEYGEYDNISKDISFESFKSANECFILTKPSGNKAVISYRYKDEIEIFDTEKRKSIIIIKGPEGFDVDLDYKANLAYRNKNTRFAFFNGVATDKFIYLLYSGNQHESEYRDYCNTIYVYDWEGNPIKKIGLNKYVLSLSVAKDNSMIYAYDPYSGQIVQTKI